MFTWQKEMAIVTNVWHDQNHQKYNNCRHQHYYQSPKQLTMRSREGFLAATAAATSSLAARHC